VSYPLSIWSSMLVGLLPGTAQRNPPNAEAILRKMAAVYGECNSYRDRGTIVREFRGGSSFKDTKTFSTLFVRPHRFRFELNTDPTDVMPQRYVIWRTGPEARSWTSLRSGVHMDKSLARAIAGAEFASGGSASRIPRLLKRYEFEDSRIVGLGISFTGVADLTGIQLKGLQPRLGRKCYQITGRQLDERHTLWIDSQTHLLRAIEATRKSGPDLVVEITTYHPEINKPISTPEFRFTPPHARSSIPPSAAIPSKQYRQ